MNMLMAVIVLMFGFIFLSLSLSRHYKEVTHKKQHLTKNIKWIFKCSGYILLVCAAALLINVSGLTLGLVYWCALASLITFLLSIILAYKPDVLLFILVIMNGINKKISANN